MPRADWSAVCIHCTPGRRCEEHRQVHRTARSETVKRTLRLVSISLEDMLGTHRWIRHLGRNGAGVDLGCLDCGASIVWDARNGAEPRMGGPLVRCPGKVIAKIPPQLPAAPPPCNAGHDRSVTCEYCEPPATAAE